MRPSGGGFWRGKKVLVTGHTGFKGAWLSLWLRHLGAEVFGFSLPPPSEPALYDLLGGHRKFLGIDTGDVRNYQELASAVSDWAPQVVFHLAAQSLVREGYRSPRTTLDTNIRGSWNLLEALKGVDNLRAVVVVTSDKVYAENGNTAPYREDAPLGGTDPYSASKAASEVVLAPYREWFLSEKKIGVASARAGNVIGGGDWAKERLVPDMVRAWGSGGKVIVRNPSFVRPWQHVLEPLQGYLTLAERLWSTPDLAGPFNFGPSVGDCLPVADVVEIASQFWGGAGFELEKNKAEHHEARVLLLDSSKATEVLGYAPRWSVHEGIDRTISWYQAFFVGNDPLSLCMADLRSFDAGQYGAGIS